jgi:hypothetical protein
MTASEDLPGRCSRLPGSRWPRRRMAPRRHGRFPDTAESGAARSLAVTESKRPPDTNNTKPSQNADARAVPGPPVALVAGAGWNVRYPAEALALSAGALAVPAPWPAAGPALAFLQLVLGPADAAFSGHLLLGVLDPANELVSGQRNDVLPGIECRRVGDQRPCAGLREACALPHRTLAGCSQGHGSGPGASLFHQLSGTDRRVFAGWLSACLCDFRRSDHPVRCRDGHLPELGTFGN